MQVYLTNICDFDEIDINRLASFISIEDISKYRYFDDVKRHILSEILKYIGYKMFTGIDEYLVVKRGKYGKPYYETCEICFNISHAGNYVVMAIGTSEVGIDIEPNTYIDFDKLLELFHPEEQKQVILGNLSFHELWCAKEAYLKYIGQGFSNGLDSCFILNNDRMTVNDCKGKRISCNLQKIDIVDKYTIFICCREEDDKINFEIIDKSIIMDYFKEA